MSTDLVQILDGNTFVVSDRRGDIEASLTDPTGLFSFDTRFLSRWVLSINGERLHALSTDDLHYWESRFFLVLGTGTVYVDAKLSVIRQRAVGAGFHEELIILNHDDEPVDLVIRVDAATDFADLFEVKDALQKQGTYDHRIDDGRLVLRYHRDTYAKETWISATEPGAIDEHGLTFTRRVAPHGRWSTELDVRAVLFPALAAATSRRTHGPTRRPHLDMARSLERWLDHAPKLESDSDSLKATYHRSLVDLAALRFSPLTMDGRSLPAAGLPWFMTMFGRDSILTSLQALPFVPELAETTLRALAERQGSRLDDFRDEDPGRILHEMRFGEMTAFEERPHSPYFGSADATPLFVVLLDEYERWSGNSRLVRELETEARAALNWIDEYADLQGNGYVAYQRRNEETGLENQCWKDSWDAKMRGARLARSVWRDTTYAEQLERQAADLKRRFNRDFWVADGEYFAIALDADGRQVDSLTSNNGHLLWSGIVDKSKAKAVARHLMSKRMFSGWGVRTLAEGEGRYNPIGYHVGTVWPFDSSFIAWGLRNYGFKDEAAVLAAGIIDAAEFFGGRLPPPAHQARPRTRRRPARGRRCAPRSNRSRRTPRHPRTLGSRRRLRTRARRHQIDDRTTLTPQQGAESP
jgi:glycogen debranching enzyme